MGCRGCDGNYCRICANPTHNGLFWHSLGILACMALAGGIIVWGISFAL